MRCAVTVLQHKRVAMPYIFGKYAFPRMRDAFCGSMDLHHVFHRRHNPSAHLASNKDMGAEHVEKVKKFIRERGFPNATIFGHDGQDQRHVLLPSISAALSLAKGADLHLWLEDDAIVLDESCGKWCTILGSADVGLYKNTADKEMINTAYFLSTQEFDERFARMVQEFTPEPALAANGGRWAEFAGRGSQLEHLAWRAARKAVLLDGGCATRHHPHAAHRRTKAEVREWLLRRLPEVAPEDLALLDLDFDD